MTYDVRGKAITNTRLLNIAFSDGDMQYGKGAYHQYFTEEQKQNLTFNKHKWLGGEAVVSYKGDIIFITTNGLKANYNTASDILKRIQTGYTQDTGLLED